MSVGAGLVIAIGAGLAFANGSNDVSKGIATLVGTGVASHSRAIAWGALWTGVGGLLGARFAGAMLETFGSGLFAPGITPAFTAALAALVGAAGWLLFASRTGLPVSTTHALVGSVVGVATLAGGVASVRWGSLGAKVLLPLALSPLAALALTGALLRATRPARGGVAADCLCADVAPTMVTAMGPMLAAGRVQLRLTTGTQAECVRGEPAALRLTLSQLHWITSGAASLARAMNDAPKMVALLLSCSLLLGKVGRSAGSLFAVVTAGMVLGSLIGGRKVTRRLATDVTAMDAREGFIANLVTAGLVGSGAIFGLPMSTTHVASGGIFSAGAERGSLNRRAVRDILLAWVVTLPVAAALGMGAYVVVTHVVGLSRP
ncbi:MAG: inorganic phosphate transporter [Deltaproteobacteria bacterium]